MDSLSKEIGVRIRDRREGIALTREQLAEKSDLSVQFIAEVECGRSRMSTTSLYKIARTLNLSADDILFGDERKLSDSEVDELLVQLTKRDRELAVDILRKFVEAVKK